MAFQCVVVTPEEQTLDETVTQVILPAHDGEIGILTDRAPLLVKLGQGSLRLDLANSTRRTLYIEGGVAQMKDNRLTILTQEAIRPEDINRETVRAERAEAEARRTTDAKSAEDRQRRLARARALESLATK
ncbi:MAG TPA: ATP synthase F1 subunit epsilon [Tepidisphaeraceae bacterium]|jgi:F-type H+-transporting ATPase subunit epsilon